MRDRIRLRFPAEVDASGRVTRWRSARDWWLFGINYPWVRNHYGWDIGVDDPPSGPMGPWTSPLQTGGNFVRQVTEDFRFIRDPGHLASPVVRWFLLGDGRTIVDWSATGYPTGIRPRSLARLNSVMSAATGENVFLIWVILDFKFVDHPGQSSNHSDVVTHHGCHHPQGSPPSPPNPALCKQQAFMENVLRPLIRSLRAQDNIVAWDLINEPEWITSDLYPLRVSLGRPLPTSDQMKGFFDAMIRVIREEETVVTRKRHITVGVTQPLPGRPRTLRWIVDWNERAGNWQIGFYQIHSYFTPSYPSQTFHQDIPDISSLRLNKPVIIGECSFKKELLTGADITNHRIKQLQAVQHLVQRAWNLGYAGCLVWSHYTEDSDLHNLIENESMIPSGSRTEKPVCAALRSFYSSHLSAVNIVK